MLTALPGESTRFVSREPAGAPLSCCTTSLENTPGRIRLCRIGNIMPCCWQVGSFVRCCWARVNADTFDGLIALLTERSHLRTRFPLTVSADAGSVFALHSPPFSIPATHLVQLNKSTEQNAFYTDELEGREEGRCSELIIIQIENPILGTTHEEPREVVGCRAVVYYRCMECTHQDWPEKLLYVCISQQVLSDSLPNGASESWAVIRL